MKSSSAINQYLKEQASLDLLRFITCGSVDDGKSTLIGRMLYESQMIFDDQVASLKNDSKKHGTQGEDIDFALLVDGLSAEREQGITIDVAYRYFATPNRKFIIADTPGHIQYTRNMVTGASTANLALLLVDARHGVIEQTKRPIAAQSMGITAGILKIKETIFPAAIPKMIPAIPPNSLKKTASIKNCVKISCFVAPIAFLIPISLILSVTETSIIFIIPIPATTSAITLTINAKSFIPLVNPERVSIISSLVTISKSFSSPGLTFRIDRIIPITSCLVFS